MKTITTFFASRTLARAASVEMAGKVKDFGTDAPKGERWGVVCEAEDVPAVEVQPEVDLSTQLALLKASVQKTAETKVISRRRCEVYHVLNLKNRKVPVTVWTRNAA